MFCPNCGSLLSDPTATKCPRCGGAVEAQAASPLPYSGGGASANTMPSDPPTPGYGAPYQMPQPQAYQPAPPPVWAGAAPPPLPKPRKRRTWLLVLFLVVIVACIGAVLLSQLPNLTSDGALYSNTLRGTASGWVTNSDCFFQLDGYHIKGSYICYAPINAQQNALATVKAKQTSGEDTFLYYGLVLRRVSAGNYYMFAIDSEGKWRFGKVVDGTYTAIIKEQTAQAIDTNQGATNTLTAQAKGQHFIFQVNGTTVGETDDGTYTTGLWGLSSSDGIEVAYTDLKITRV